jgi:hypothetical protein
LLLFFRKEESSFSEEKEAKRLYSPACSNIRDLATELRFSNNTNGSNTPSDPGVRERGAMPRLPSQL